MQNVMKLYPGWKEAVTQIVDRVSREGYGIIISFETLFSIMDIRTPERATAQEWQKHNFKVLDHIENLKSTLLEEHNICLHNVKGQGYQVLTPDDQVTIAADKRFRNAMRQVRQAVNVITHVDMEALTFEGQQKQARQLEKAGFLHAVMSKKKLGGGPGTPLLALPE